MKGSFIHPDFLIETATGRRLYHRFAEGRPIIDYHCHLDPADIARDRRWETITSIWMASDHYKWRAMRTAGVPEEFCTGGAPDREKFRKFAEVLPKTLRNPLYHWCHLELARYFGITDLLGPDNADEIYETANAVLASGDFSARGILEKSNVRVICTTDDPLDTLEHHRAIAADPSIRTLVLPTWRPDKAWAVDKPDLFRNWAARLGGITGSAAGSLDAFLSGLKARHAFFADHGCLLSDRGVGSLPVETCTRAEAAAIFESCRSGGSPSPEDARKFRSFMLDEFGAWDAEREWVMQIHTGVIRNANSRAFATLGHDTGHDSIGDFPQAEGLAAHLDRLESRGLLPRTVLYNLNPADNEVFAAMAGNFQGGGIPGKIQLGSGWWFLDQADGMTRQIEALSQIGLLSFFVGMLTDSRSFLSYTRHEYFRRILCNILGKDVEKGYLPDDEAMLGGLIGDICHRNAENYFRFPLTEGNG